MRQRKPAPKGEENNAPAPRQDKKEEERPKSAMELAQEKYRKFFTRSIWGALMISGFAAILYSNHYLVCLFVVILQIIVFREMIALRYAEAKEKNLKGFRTVHWWFLFVTFFYLYGAPTLQEIAKLMPNIANLDLLLRSHLAISFALYVVGFVGFIVTLEKDYYKYQFGQLTWTLMTLLLVVGQSNFVIRNILKGLFWLVMPASCIICNDIMAYFCGFAFGRKFIDRPLTSLSPNKTWEGFVGAFILTLVWSFFFSGVLAQFQWMICPKVPSEEFLVTLQCIPDPVFTLQSFPLPSVLLPILSSIGFHQQALMLYPVQFHALLFALFASLIAPFGGFFASGIKRAYRIKDFDSLFPGHGGMTDRMDCQFIMGLFTYVYYSSFVRGHLTAGQLVQSIAALPVDEQQYIFEQLRATLKI